MMKLHRSGLSAVAACFLVLIPLTGNAQMVTDAETGSIALSGDSQVPFKLVGNKIYVKAEIDGQPFAFIFDTGGAANLSPEIRKRLKLASDGRADVYGIGNSAENIEFVRVPRLKIGNVSYQNGRFGVLDFPGLSASPFPGVPYGGIFGREVFRHVVTTIDYARSVLRFSEPATFRPEKGAFKLALTMRGDEYPNIEALVDGHAGRFDIDTGGAGGLLLGKGFIQSSHLDQAITKSVDVVVGRGAGGLLLGRAARFSSLQLGPLRLRRPIGTILDGSGGVYADGQTGNLGAEILRRFTVTIDLSRGALYLQPNAHINEPFDFNRSGIFSAPEGAAERALLIVPNSPASAAGIRAGDDIQSINGRRMTHYDIRAMWQRPAGTVVRITFERAARVMHGTLVLRDLL